MKEEFAVTEVVVHYPTPFSENITNNSHTRVVCAREDTLSVWGAGTPGSFNGQYDLGDQINAEKFKLLIAAAATSHTYSSSLENGYPSCRLDSEAKEGDSVKNGSHYIGT